LVNEESKSTSEVVTELDEGADVEGKYSAFVDAEVRTIRRGVAAMRGALLPPFQVSMWLTPPVAGL
jgi:hypothetical protein